MSNKVIQNISSLITLLRVQYGYVDRRGNVYDQNGVSIDFPRE